MLKILILFILFSFLISQVFKLIFRPFIFVNQQRAQNRQPFQKPPDQDGDVRIDYVPQKDKKGNFNGGEYVDFEEVKS